MSVLRTPPLGAVLAWTAAAAAAVQHVAAPALLRCSMRCRRRNNRPRQNRSRHDRALTTAAGAELTSIGLAAVALDAGGTSETCGRTTVGVAARIERDRCVRLCGDGGETSETRREKDCSASLALHRPRSLRPGSAVTVARPPAELPGLSLIVTEIS
jgi:hypothetical protein